MHIRELISIAGKPVLVTTQGNRKTYQFQLRDDAELCAYCSGTGTVQQISIAVPGQMADIIDLSQLNTVCKTIRKANREGSVSDLLVHAINYALTKYVNHRQIGNWRSVSGADFRARKGDTFSSPRRQPWVPRKIMNGTPSNASGWQNCRAEGS